MKLYPLVRATLLFISGLILGKYLELRQETVSDFCGLLLVFTLAAYLLWRNLPHRGTRFIYLCGLGLFIISTGIFRYSLSGEVSPRDISRYISDREVEVTGAIRGEPVFQRHSARFDLSCRELTGGTETIRVTGLLRVIFYGQVREAAEKLRCGNCVRITARLTRPGERGNPGEVSQRSRLAARGIHARSTIYRAGDIVLIDEPGAGNLPCLAVDLKHRLQEIIRRSLPGPRGRPGSLQSALLEALLLGERKAIPYEIKETFRSIGVIHVLVVSGLHVGFIWLLGAFILSPLPIRWRHALIIPLVAGYVLLTGAGTATVWAGVMACVYSLAIVLNQPRNTLTAIGAAALALLLFNPLSLFGAGFQLSFLIVITIITLVPVFDRWFRKMPAWLRPFLTVPLAAQIGALPLVAYYFHFISVPALLANILIVPLVGIIVGLGFTAAVAGLIGWPLAWLVNYPNRFLITGLLKLTGWFSRLPLTGLPVGGFPVIWIVIWYLVIFLPASLHHPPERRRTVIAGCVLLILAGGGVYFLPRPPSPLLQAIYFNTRSGDQTLFREADGTTVLVSSDDDRFGDIPTVLVPYLRREGIGRIDYLVLTGAGLDHLNVVNRLLEHVAVGTVLDHPLGPSSPSYPRFREVLDENTIRYRRLAADDLVETGGSSLAVLWPRCRAGTPFSPDHSLVIKIGFGDVTFLLPSRIGITAQEELVDTLLDLRATVLKTPWRGSSAHISPSFLKAVDPDYALLIQGQKYFGRFPRDCGDFLRDKGAEVHATSEEGCLIVETDGTSCKIISTLEYTGERMK